MKLQLPLLLVLAAAVLTACSALRAPTWKSQCIHKMTRTLTSANLLKPKALLTAVATDSFFLSAPSFRNFSSLPPHPASPRKE